MGQRGINIKTEILSDQVSGAQSFDAGLEAIQIVHILLNIHWTTKRKDA